MDNAVSALVASLQRFEAIDDCVTFLEAEIARSGHEIPDVQRALTALDSALRAHARQIGIDPDAVLCSFCGRSQDDVYCLLTSSQSAICDACVDNATVAVSTRLGRTGWGRVRTWAHRLSVRVRRAWVLRTRAR